MVKGSDTSTAESRSEVRRKVLVTHENSNIEITGELLRCLRPGAWLNDEVINLYLQHILLQEVSVDMSGQLTPAKRQHNRNEPNVRGKWQKTAAFISQNLRIPPGTSFFRVLCPSSKGGSVIGKGGGIISQIRQETGAKVRIEGTVSGCDERIIVISESDKENGGSEHNKVEEEKNAIDEVDNSDEQEKEGEDKESVATTDKESDAAKDPQCEKGPSSAKTVFGGS